MDSLSGCTICGKSPAAQCNVCRSTNYCSRECQQTDWREHMYLCRAYKEMMTSQVHGRPLMTDRLAIFFPMITSSCQPKLIWVPTKTLESVSDQKEPELSHLLTLPGHPGPIGCATTLVRGNMLRGRPKFLDTLCIRYIIESSVNDPNFQVNNSLHGGPLSVCFVGLGEHFWRGPIVAFLRPGNDPGTDAPLVGDMTLTAYRDAIDYLGYFAENRGSAMDPDSLPDALSKMNLERRTGKINGVRINCQRDQDSFGVPQFESVEVPKLHPLFHTEAFDPLDIVLGLGEEWVMMGYSGPLDEGAPNMPVCSLSLRISEELLGAADWAQIPTWRSPVVRRSVLIVDRRGRDLSVDKVRAVCAAIDGHVLPLLAKEDTGSGRIEVVNALSVDLVAKYMVPLQTIPYIPLMQP